MSDKDGWNLELLKEDLKYSFPLFGRIHVRFGQEYRMFVRRYFELRESIFPQKFHIFPMFNDAMLDGVPKFEHTSFACIDIITHEYFRLVVGTGYDDFIFRTADAE